MQSRPVPLPHQLAGALFLAARDRALLADEPRVGKTGAAIIASDYAGARKILVVTTASGRPVWRRGFADWSIVPAETAVLTAGALTAEHLAAPRLIVGWAALDRYAEELVSIQWDLLIVDESHYAKTFSAKRTKALYSRVVKAAKTVWCLTGTPIPNSPLDLFPMLVSLFPEVLKANSARGWPDVSRYDAFLDRYCAVKPKRITAYKTITVVVGGRNLDELKDRIGDIWLRRTQADVGITEPTFSILPVAISDAERRRLEKEAPPDLLAVLDAVEDGTTALLDEHLARIRALTGTLKAKGVAQAVLDDLEGGTEKIVVMAWHKEALDLLEGALKHAGCVRVDGSTTPNNRTAAQARFATDPACRVFIGQIVACGEAIDLSAAADLIFAESSFVPKDMKQASLRITNHGQALLPRVRVAALEGSIDEAIQIVLTRKVQTIQGVLRT